MRYGLEPPTGGVFADVPLLAELAALAEGAGWDGVFLEDYIVHQIEPDAPTCDPWIALATERIRLGTTVTPLSRRRPWKVARETVSLDQLSGGRLILGVGLGDVADPGFGGVAEIVDRRARAQRLDEALTNLVGLWSGEAFTYQRAHFTVAETTLPATPDPDTPASRSGSAATGPIRASCAGPRAGTVSSVARCMGPTSRGASRPMR